MAVAVRNQPVGEDRIAAARQSGKPLATPSKYQFVDALRGIAILMVILYHTRIPAGPKWLQLLFDQGARGVQLFFLVSGFTLYLSLSHRKQNEAHPTRDYFIRRAFRILPGFYLAFAIYEFWRFFLEPNPAWLDFFGFARPDVVGYTLTFLPFIAAWHWPSIRTRVPGGWSIAVETSFYLALPFIFKKVRTFAQAVWFTAGMVALAEVSEKLLLPVFTRAYGTVRALEFLQQWPLSQVGFFGFGMVFYFWFVAPNRPEVTKKILRISCVAGSVVALIVAALMLRYHSHFYAEGTAILKTPLRFSYGLMFLGLAMWLCTTKPKILVNRFTAFIGVVSYSAYLFHFLVLRLVTLVIPSPTVFQSVFLVIPVVVLASTGVAYLSFRYVETPFINLGKRLIEKLEKPKKPVPTLEPALEGKAYLS